MTEHDTLHYARQMMDSGRFAAARRALHNTTDEAAQALLAEMAALEASGTLPANAQRSNPMRLRFQFDADITLQTAQARLHALQTPPTVIAPRWQRRLVVDTAAAGETLRFRVASRAASRYEWRFVPTTARGQIEQFAGGHIRVTGEARAQRSMVAAVVVAINIALISIIYLLAANMTLACGSTMVLMIGTFYLVPSLMRHTRAVSEALIEDLRAAIIEGTRPTAPPPPLPRQTTFPAGGSALLARLLALKDRRRTPAVDWPHKLHLRHEETASGLRFRLTAQPMLFWDWWWTPPDISGQLRTEGDQTTLSVSSNPRYDVLALLLAVVFVVVAGFAALVQAAVWARVVVMGLLLLAMAVSLPVARHSILVRNAILADFIIRVLTGYEEGRPWPKNQSQPHSTPPTSAK